MLSPTPVKDLPGYYSFRWTPKSPIDGFTDIAIVFKVPGRTDLSSIPDLVELICRGPFVPDAVVLVHIEEDAGVPEVFREGATANSLVRFNGRLPLLRFAIPLSTSAPTVTMVRPPRSENTKNLRERLKKDADEWLNAGLRKLFDPTKIIVKAPAGYAFHKPSQSKATYFIRAEQGLETSGCVAFVAFAIWQRLKNRNKKIPTDLINVFVDSMTVATVAYALRELFILSKAGTPPQIESFHSYGGLEHVKPIPGNSLCLISASSSMNLHREWVSKKRVPDRDVLTLVTFDDSEDKDQALCCISSADRPRGEEVTAIHDIKIKGENFIPVAELPRLVLLRKPFHGDDKTVEVFQDFAGKDVFRLFKSATKSSAQRRGLFCDGSALICTDKFKEDFLEPSLTQYLRASTRYIVYQEDKASQDLAEMILVETRKLASLQLTILSASEAPDKIQHKNSGLIVVAAVCGGGAALLSISRSLRGVQTGPRTFIIGLQISDTKEHIQTVDKNITQSAHGAAIEIVRYRQIAIGKAIESSFNSELSVIYGASTQGISDGLKSRVRQLREGEKGDANVALLPSGNSLDKPLELRKDFAFWTGTYPPGAYHAEVVGTIAALLQRAREPSGLPLQHRLHTGSLQHVLLDPENFARFDDGVIQAALLRAAQPSELDYRGEKNASEYMRDFLVRMAGHLTESRGEAALEFLTALAIGRLRIEKEHLDYVVAKFNEANKGRRAPINKAMVYLLSLLDGKREPASQIPF
jgi:hypothetical protein